MFSGIPEEFSNIATRVKTTFVDDLGNHITGIGTGFWYTEDGFSRAFITNKHNLDPKLNPNLGKKYQLQDIEIELRRIEGKEILTDETKFFKIKDYLGLFHSQNEDVSLIHLPQFEDAATKTFQHSAAMHGANQALADERFFKNNVRMMDSCCFVGFPGSPKTKEEWWDKKGNFPIARNASIASRSDGYYKNESIVTNDVILVSGMSFKGSSGSPVFSFQKGLKGVLKMAGTEDENYVPPKLIGIMSGHWQTNEPDMFKHGGLSYFTRSTSILRLIEQAKENVEETKKFLREHGVNI